jgi:hypothetical protein
MYCRRLVISHNGWTVRYALTRRHTQRGASVRAGWPGSVSGFLRDIIGSWKCMTSDWRIMYNELKMIRKEAILVSSTHDTGYRLEKMSKTTKNSAEIITEPWGSSGQGPDWVPKMVHTWFFLDSVRLGQVVLPAFQLSPASCHITHGSWLSAVRCWYSGPSTKGLRLSSLLRLNKMTCVPEIILQCHIGQMYPLS